MRNFNYNKLAGRTWDGEIIGLVAQIHEYKGRQELYLKQLTEQGILVRNGTGRSTFYTRSDAQ